MDQDLSVSLCLAPFARLAWRYYTGDLTPNPIEFITHFTGDWAIRMVVMTLAISPLRKLLRVPDLIRFRRMIGLFAFFYASLHFATWFGVDKGFDMHEILADFTKRRFIIMGLIGYVCMIPLTITSTKGWIRRLGGQAMAATPPPGMCHRHRRCGALFLAGKIRHSPAAPIRLPGGDSARVSRRQLAMDTAHAGRFLMLPIDHVTVAGSAVSQKQATPEDLGSRSFMAARMPASNTLTAARYSEEVRSSRDHHR